MLRSVKKYNLNNTCDQKRALVILMMFSSLPLKDGEENQPRCIVVVIQIVSLFLNPFLTCLLLIIVIFIMSFCLRIWNRVDISSFWLFFVVFLFLWPYLHFVYPFSQFSCYFVHGQCGFSALLQPYWLLQLRVEAVCVEIKIYLSTTSSFKL